MLDDQLKLPLPEEHAGRRLPERIRPMQAAAVDAPFDDADYFFEPWWPGARALAFIESGRLRMTVSGLSDPIAAFPELRELPQQVVGDGIVLDGTLLVLDDEGRPDAELLRARLTGGARALGGLPGRLLSRLGLAHGAKGSNRMHGRSSMAARLLFVADQHVVTDGNDATAVRQRGKAAHPAGMGLDAADRLAVADIPPD